MLVDESDRASVEQRRAMVDMVAQLRSRAIRVALFGSLVHRPDPDGVETQDERTANTSVLIDTVRWITRTYEIMRDGKDPWSKLPDRDCVWISDRVKKDADILRYAAQMDGASRRIAAAAEKDEGLGAALRDHYEVRRDGFMPAVTKFCDRLWAAADYEQARSMHTAFEAVETTQKTLERMENIAKHVRLVAINAAVEANRMGDAGRGIAFIAAEFKSLAEELQNMSAGASADISKILNSVPENREDAA